MDDIKQDWSFIDKWFDDYGHTLEPRELARWAYSNGMWQKDIITYNNKLWDEAAKNITQTDLYID